MMSNPYVDGISDKVSHNFASSLTPDLIAAGKDSVTIAVVCPDRWFLGDYAVVTSRDGGAFAGEVEGMDVCTGEVTIRGVGQMSARITPLPGHRAGSARRCSHAVIEDPGTNPGAGSVRPGRSITHAGSLESAWRAGEALDAAFVLILVLGLRNGEVLGLTWELVGLHAELYIGEQLQPVGGPLLRRDLGAMWPPICPGRRCFLRSSVKVGSWKINAPAVMRHLDPATTPLDDIDRGRPDRTPIDQARAPRPHGLRSVPR
jgi:hypothetical protein